VPRVQPDHNAMSSIVGRARSETLPVWVLLPLRAFLGFTFVFAGLQKVADRQFFTAGAPGSIQLQLQASIRTSPVHFLVNLALHAPVAFGLVIALAEIAIGLGVTFGLIGRVAAAGGMLLSLLFFLTVSFNTWPYYYGSDIAFFFAWTPLVLAGSGPLSLDALLQDRARRKVGASSDAPLEGDLGRRALLGQLGAAGLVGAGGLFLAGLTAAIGRAANRQTGSSTGGLTPIGGGTSATSTGASTPGSTSPTSGGAHVAGTGERRLRRIQRHLHSSRMHRRLSAGLTPRVRLSLSRVALQRDDRTGHPRSGRATASSDQGRPERRRSVRGRLIQLPDLRFASPGGDRGTVTPQ